MTNVTLDPVKKRARESRELHESGKASTALLSRPFACLAGNKSAVSTSHRGCVLKTYSRTQTGVVGISVVRSASNRRDGTLQVFFSVHLRRPDGRKMNRKFCVSTLGKVEAWRRAVRFRAVHELRVARETRELHENGSVNSGPEKISRSFACFAGKKSEAPK